MAKAKHRFVVLKHATNNGTTWPGQLVHRPSCRHVVNKGLPRRRLPAAKTLREALRKYEEQLRKRGYMYQPWRQPCKHCLRGEE